MQIFLPLQWPFFFSLGYEPVFGHIWTKMKPEMWKDYIKLVYLFYFILLLFPDALFQRRHQSTIWATLLVQSEFVFRWCLFFLGSSVYGLGGLWPLNPGALYAKAIKVPSRPSLQVQSLWFFFFGLESLWFKQVPNMLEMDVNKIKSKPNSPSMLSPNLQAQPKNFNQCIVQRYSLGRNPKTKKRGYVAKFFRSLT